MTCGPLVLAVDAGGSGTRAAVVGADGGCTGFGAGPAGNPTSTGAGPARAAITAAAAAAVSAAGHRSVEVGAVLVALAGSSALLPPAAVARSLSGALRGPVDPDRVRVVPDVLATYHSGAVEPTGVAVVAGTGSVAVRVDADRVAALVGGSGWLLGDGGSGFAVGHRVVRAVVAELEGTGPATALTGLLLGELGIEPDGPDRARVGGRSRALGELMDDSYAGRPTALARFAPLAFRADRDPVAAGIVAGAVRELAALVGAVRPPGTPGPVVLGGSVLVEGILGTGVSGRGGPGRGGSRPHLPAPAGELGRALSGADLRTAGDGVLGAAVLALRMTGAPVGTDTFDRLAASLAAARATSPTAARIGSPGAGSPG